MVAGAGSLGSLPAFFLGGLITERTQNSLIVYYVALAIHVVLICSTWIFLPESLSAERRKQLYEEEAETLTTGIQPGGIIRRVRALFTTILHPLAFVWPLADSMTGKRNLRIMWCSLHSFLRTLGTGYISSVILVYLTTKTHFKPDEVRQLPFIPFGSI